MMTVHLEPNGLFWSKFSEQLGNCFIVLKEVTSLSDAVNPVLIDIITGRRRNRADHKNQRAPQSVIPSAHDMV